MIIFKYLFIFAVLYFKPIYLTKYISASVNGSLNNSLEINFTIIPIELKGFLFYCIDFESNQISLKFIAGNQKKIQINLNQFRKLMLLKEICGCDPCNHIHFYLKSSGGSFNASCNSFDFRQFLNNKEKIDYKDENIDISNYPVPKSLKIQQLFIMMGNVGPYVGKDNESVMPWREQFVGCVDSLYLNGSKITFNDNNNDRIISPCPTNCFNNICNGGLCQQISLYNVTCDCNTVALNGRYCNDNMKAFDRRESYSFQITKEDISVYLKMTWKVLIMKNYCLMEIIGKDTNATLSINNNHLMNDKSVFADINSDGTNFVTLTYRNQHLNIKINNISRTPAIFLFGMTRINVGFAERNMICEQLQGVYDIRHNLSHLVVTKDLSTDIITVDKRTRTKTVTIVVIFTSVLAGCFVLFTITCLVFYARSHREIQRKITMIEALSTNHLDKTSYGLSESRIYGKVVDSDNYDSIQETDIYDIIKE